MGDAGLSAGCRTLSCLPESPAGGTGADRGRRARPRWEARSRQWPGPGSPTEDRRSRTSTAPALSSEPWHYGGCRTSEGAAGGHSPRARYRADQSLDQHDRSVDVGLAGNAGWRRRYEHAAAALWGSCLCPAGAVSRRCGGTASPPGTRGSRCRSAVAYRQDLLLHVVLSATVSSWWLRAAVVVTEADHTAPAVPRLQGTSCPSGRGAWSARIRGSARRQAIC